MNNIYPDSFKPRRMLKINIIIITLIVFGIILFFDGYYNLSYTYDVGAPGGYTGSPMDNYGKSCATTYPPAS